MRRLSGLTADQCAAGLVAAARSLGVEPLQVFGTRGVRRAAMARKAVAAVVLSAEAKPRGLTQAVARVLALRPTGIAPSGLGREGATSAVFEAVASAMTRAGFDPATVGVGCEPKASKTGAKPAQTVTPCHYTMETLPDPVRQPLQRWLKAFNAGEMTLNIVKLRLLAAMTKAGLDEARCPPFPALHRAAKTLRRQAADQADTAAKLDVTTDRAAQAQLAERVEAMRAAAERRVYRPALEPDPVRIPDVRYGANDTKPLDLGAADGQLVEACVAQGGFPRAVEIKPGVTVWADHADRPWRFRPEVSA